MANPEEDNQENDNPEDTGDNNSVPSTTSESKKRPRRKKGIDELTSQRTYAQLLIDILEGKELNPLSAMQLAIESNKEIKLLPDSEYQPPSAEPDNPEWVGINETMSFNPNKGRLYSVLELFGTSELQKEFIQAFSWAIDIDHINKIHTAHFEPDVNLLQTEFVLPTSTQITIIEYILLCLDAIGKLAGKEGELAIQNIAPIRAITDSLANLAKSAQTPSIQQDPSFENNILKMRNDLIKKNKKWYKMRHHPQPDTPVKLNPDMNFFCHLNEILSHRLVGLETHKSILAPETIQQNVLKKLLNQKKKARKQK